MTIAELLSNSALLNIIRAQAPRSQFSGQPLTLVTNGRSLSFENSLESDWWVGAADGVYTRQDRRAVSDDTIIAAAAAAGIAQSDVDSAFLHRIATEASEARAIHARHADLLAKDADARARRQEASRAALAEKHPELLDSHLAMRALAELEELLSAHPRAVKMTRKGMLVDADGAHLAPFTNLTGMRAWLHQHGLRASVDDREHFMAAAL